MVIAAAICPHPPGLLRQLGVGLPEMEPVRVAAHRATAALVAMQPRRIFVFGPDAMHVDADESAGGSFSCFGCDLQVGGRSQNLPAAYAVAAWLLDEARWTGPRRYLSHPQRPDSDLPTSTDAVLVMADADTSVGVSAPTHADPRAVEQHAQIAAALSSGDAAALTALDVEAAREFGGSGTAPLQQFGRRWQAVHNDSVSARAQLLYDAAPFGVRYWVATWRAAESAFG